MLCLATFVDVQGGFDSNDSKYETEDVNSLVVLPEWKEFPLPDESLPPMVGLIYVLPSLSCV